MSKTLKVPVRWVRRRAGLYWLILKEPNIMENIDDAYVFAVLERWQKEDGGHFWSVGLKGCGDRGTLTEAKAAAEKVLGVIE